MTKENEDSRYLGELSPYASAYSDLIAERKATGVPMAIGKHTAANAMYCKQTIEALQATGHHSAADWAIWMMWWRMQDRTVAQQIDDMRVEEIKSLQKRVDELEGEKRGIGPDAHYA
jgi:uncharacterized membrane protein